MRTRKKTPLFTAKTNGQVIRHCEVKLSTQGRINQILRELGGDPKQTLRDLRWENLCKQVSLINQ